VSWLDGILRQASFVSNSTVWLLVADMNSNGGIVSVGKCMFGGGALVG